MGRLMGEEGVTHMCGAPIVMATLLNTPEAEKRPLAKQVKFVVAGAPPPRRCIAAMQAAGFAVCHVYGSDRMLRPSVVNEWHGEWKREAGRRSRPRLTARRACASSPSTGSR